MRFPCLVVYVVLLGCVLGSANGQTSKPNIVLLLTDDQCFDTISALGHPEVKTPNLDRLAHRGVAFTNAYNMGGWNGAICVASRTMMNTGRFIWRAHQLDSKEKLQERAAERKMFSQRLHDAGYTTYMSGKWHVKIDAEEIFDHVRHVRPGMPKDTPSSYSRPNDKDDWHPWDTALGGFWEGGKHWSEVLADDALDYISMAKEDSRPYFMYLAFNAPHDPRQSPKEFVDMYPRQQIAIPINFLPENPFMEQMGAGKSLRDEKLSSWPRTAAAVQLHRQEYYALITHLDTQIGRILDALETSGQADNTYIVMTADHGLACGQHGLLGKQSMYEHSMKAPLLVAGPGIPRDKRISAPVYVQDFMATALDWADVSDTEDVEFRSLLPLIAGVRSQQYSTIYGAYEMNRQRMIRSGNYKLIYYPQADKYLLFNVASDPYELEDLSENAAFGPQFASLQVQLNQLMSDMGDPMLQNQAQ
ncbi:MAG: sulfatase-like hydrolase/transferase [Planctomycetales bacterium]|nr:sulfatase-like hydrolase/transferase [Planctomycetales bacterium]